MVISSIPEGARQRTAYELKGMLGNGSTGRFHGLGPGMQPAVASLQERGKRKPF